MTLANRPAAVALLAASMVTSGTEAADGVGALDRIRALEGEWVGETWWSNDPDRRDPVTLAYRSTGHGSAVIEDFRMQGRSVMTTVYHVDGDDLRATHFCTRNQPRLKATRFAADVIGFDFVDITNLASPDAGHVSGLELRTATPDRLEIRFTYTRAGVDVYEHIELRRSEEAAETR